MIRGGAATGVLIALVQCAANVAAVTASRGMTAIVLIAIVAGATDISADATIIYVGAGIRVACVLHLAWITVVTVICGRA